MEKEYVVRYNVPTRYDEAPFGTIIKVMGEDERFDLYIQIQYSGEELPEWVRTGMLFEKIFNDKLSDKEFLKDCLSNYRAS